jgi:hypothetical protein
MRVFILNAMTNIYMRKPDLMDSLILSESALAVVDIARGMLGVEDASVEGGAVLIFTGISRSCPEILTKEVVDRIVAFISSGLAHSSVQRLAFWALSESIGFCLEGLSYEDIRDNLRDLVCIMTNGSGDHCHEPELIAQVDAFLTGVMSKDCMFAELQMGRFEEVKREELLNIMGGWTMGKSPV